jgi:hypothetical protein
MTHLALVGVIIPWSIRYIHNAIICVFRQSVFKRKLNERGRNNSDVMKKSSSVFEREEDFSYIIYVYRSLTPRCFFKAS